MATALGTGARCKAQQKNGTDERTGPGRRVGDNGLGSNQTENWTPHRLPCCPHSLGADKPHFLQPASSIQRAVDTHTFGRRRPNKDGRGALSDLPLFNPGSAYGGTTSRVGALEVVELESRGMQFGDTGDWVDENEFVGLPRPLKRPSFLLTLSLDSGRTLLSGLVGLDGSMEERLRLLSPAWEGVLL